MAVFSAPSSLNSSHNGPDSAFLPALSHNLTLSVTSGVGTHGGTHPPFPYLILLVFEAVLEVICVSLPGYIAARSGMFDADAQKLVANLNVALFTPCLGMRAGNSRLNCFLPLWFGLVDCQSC
jgi:auxin efflux carrier family protein